MKLIYKRFLARRLLWSSIRRMPMWVGDSLSNGKNGDIGLSGRIKHNS